MKLKYIYLRYLAAVVELARQKKFVKFNCEKKKIVKSNNHVPATREDEVEEVAADGNGGGPPRTRISDKICFNTFSRLECIR